MIIGSKANLFFGGLALGAAIMQPISHEVMDISFIGDASRCRFLRSKKARIRRKWEKRLSTTYSGYVSDLKLAHNRSYYEPQVMTVEFKWAGTGPTYPCNS